MANEDWNSLGSPVAADDWNSLGTPVKPVKQNVGTGGDILTSLKRGVEEIPGIVTGLADIPTALAFGARPFTKAAEAAGEATGFQPGKWAEQAQAEYSPAARQAAEEIRQTWESPTATWGEKLGQYAKHPGYVAEQIAESLPSMVAGGVGSRALMLAGRGALERAVGEKLAAPVAAGVGEGTIQAGQSMEQAKDVEDQRKAAIAALGSGIVDAVIGAGAGRIAGKLGLETAETAMAKGFNNAVEQELSLGRRVGGGAISEGLLQELPQSTQEQVWQNYAEGKPLWEGVSRSAVEGALAGFAMGGAANIRGGKITAPVAPAVPTTPETPTTGGLTMAPPGEPIARPSAAPEGSIPYERVVPAGVELAPLGTPLAAGAPAGRAPQAPGNWELAPAGTPMSAPYKALGLPHYKFDTQIVFADGSTGTQHQVDQHLASLPEAQRMPELARMSRGAYVAPPASIPHPNAVPGTLKSAVNIAAASGAAQPVSAQPPGATLPTPTLPGGESAPFTPTTPTKEAPNGIRQPSPSGILQHPQERPGEAGGERGRVEQGVQGTEATPARQGSRAAEAGRAQAATVIRPHVATLVARKSLIDQTVPGLLDKAKQALATGQGKASDFTKAATMFPVKEAPIREALQGIAAHLGGKPTVKTAVAKARELSVGKTALSAEPITVKKGVIHIGAYPAMDYETGEDVTVPEGATPAQIKAALEKGGAIAKGHKVFGAGETPNTAANVKFSVAEPTKTEYSFIRNTLAELTAANPEVFRHEKSTSKTLDDVLNDILPGLTEVEKAKLTYPKGPDVITRRAFEAKDNKFKFYVYESTDGSVYVDISNSAPGAGGSAVYTALGDYAFNTGKKFIGDPTGLSPDAVVRRTANMLFSAIRHGTTQHLGTSAEQAIGNPAEGVPPLKWGTNNIDNFNALLQTFTDTIVNNVPELKNVRYDFEKGNFYSTKTGQVLGRDDFQLTAAKSRGARTAKAGQGTLRTAALINSLSQAAQGNDRERGRILFAVFNGKVVSGLEAMLSRTRGTELPIKPHSPETLRHDLLAALAGKERAAMQSLLNSGRARIIRSDQANKLLGGDIIRDYPDGLARAFYDPSSNTTYFIADHIDRTMPAAELRGLIRHEIAVHAYQLGRNNAEFKDILRQLDMMRRAGNTNVQEAYKRVPKGTPGEYVHEEALAYLVQHSPEMGIVQRIIAWMRNMLRSMGWVSTLTTDDILDMARTAMERSTPVWRAGEVEPMFSRTSYGELSDAQSAAVDRVVGKPPTVIERAKEFHKGWRKSLEQGVFDQYAPIRDVSQAGYIKARMSKGGDSTLEAIFMYGKPMLDENGDIKVDFKAENKGMNGFASTLAKLDGEHDRFLLWVAALRAESLKAIGLENLWSHEDIATLKTLNRGNLQNGQAREETYQTALKEMMAYNNAVLKIAEQRGLISEDTRKMYEATPYIPFYRLADEGAVQGFTAQSGMVNQHAWKNLTGGTNKLNEDLLANMLQNWSHLITASARNDAAKTTLEEAVRIGAAEEIPAGSPTKGAVVFRDNSATKMERQEDGTYKRVPTGEAERNHERSFIVNDPHLLDAITSLGAVVRVPKPLRMFKHYLTLGVTINPAFKIRNLMRDSIQSMALADLSLNPAANIAQGAKLTAKESETRAQMLASGAIIRFGSMLDGQTADMGRELVEKMGVPKDHILDDSNKIEKFWKHTVKPAFDAYQELGDRGEQVNRAALYDQLIKKGMTHGEAAYWARDLMDFSMSGSWTAIRFLTQTVPFMNARLQGLYKLGRSAQADKKRFAIVTGAVVMASLALLAAYHDDDDWKKREDWDRDNYWWFKIGGKAFYIPKPFEIGAIGTAAERMAELIGDDEMTGKRFSDNLFNLVNTQLSMNPTPQAIKPLIDLWANKDSFTGKPIETMGMEKLRPEDRYKQSTSGIARTLSELGLPNPTQLAMGHYEQMSPVQIDHLIRGYFSWVGTSATTALDYGIFRPMEKTERPAMQLQDVFLAGNFVKDLPAGSSRYVTQMYDQAKEIEQAYASYRAALRAGETERAAELMATEGGKIRQYHAVETVKRIESNLSARARMIERSNLSADEKRAELNRIEAQRDLLARRIKP